MPAHRATPSVPLSELPLQPTRIKAATKETMPVLTQRPSGVFKG